MFTKTLSEKTKQLLAILGKSGLLEKAYLGGGSACALHLGHRISIDLDFFTPDEFNTKWMLQQLKMVGDFQIEQETQDTLLGELEGIRFSLFLYEYKILFPFKHIYRINILDIRDISAMKIDAIATRGSRRDFIDLYFISKKIPLKDILIYYDQKFGKLASNLIHIQKSLVYFVDAEIEEMPKMLKTVRWEQVKSYFEKEVKKLIL